MRVIHLMSTDDYSGAENVAISIVKGLNDKEIETFYATQKGIIDEFLKERNVENVIHINGLTVNEIKRIEREYNPDIIHAHDYRASVLAAIACKKAKLISHIHNNASWIKNIFHPYSWAFLLASYRFSKILIVSDSIEKEYVFSNCLKCEVVNVGNPVSRKDILEKVNKNYSKEYDICCVGRLTEAKNPQRFINIIKEIKEKKPNIKAIWVGDGELREKVEKIVKKENLVENIKFIGFQENPYVYMAQSRMFMLTSKWEGFGLVVYEALTLGLPSIVSNVGGLPSIVDDTCGKLCYKEDDFKEESIRLLNDEEMYSLKSNNAVEKSKKLDNSKEYINKIENLYENI